MGITKDLELQNNNNFRSLIWTFGDTYNELYMSGSPDPIHIVTYYTKWVKTSWTASTKYEMAV